MLIIFYRNPELGKVKTRLATSIGDGNALAVYMKLVAHTRTITESLLVDKIVCYSNFIDREDNWSNIFFKKQLQIGDDLGNRLHNAFKDAFEAGYSSVCVIGTDCLELSNEIIKEAFEQLSNRDAVIGPARDGGYYLLGTRKFIPELFENKKWSTSTVLDATIEDLNEMNLTCQLLPTLTDIDTIDDLPEEIRAKL